MSPPSRPPMRSAAPATGRWPDVLDVHPTAAQETALAYAIAHRDTAALVDAVRTGKARLGTKAQPAVRSGRVLGGDQA